MWSANFSTLEELLKTDEILSGVESQRLRSFCTSEYMSPNRDLDEFGRMILQGQLTSVEQDFDSRVRRHLESLDSTFDDDDAVVHKATERVCDDLYRMRWGPTQVPIYNLLGLFRIIESAKKSLFLDIARFYISKGLPVDGKDLSGTTALSHSFSTKPGYDFEYAQLLFDAGGDVNHRNRHGGIVAHEIVQVYLLSQPEAKKMAIESLKWFLDHGGNVDIADSDGMVPRVLCENFQNVIPGFLKAIKKEDQRRKALEGFCCTLCGMQNPKLLVCSRCGKAKYCPRQQKQCQKLDWPKHKRTCKASGMTCLFAPEDRPSLMSCLSAT